TYFKPIRAGRADSTIPIARICLLTFVCHTSSWVVLPTSFFGNPVERESGGDRTREAALVRAPIRSRRDDIVGGPASRSEDAMVSVRAPRGAKTRELTLPRLLGRTQVLPE